MPVGGLGPAVPWGVHDGPGSAPADAPAEGDWRLEPFVASLAGKSPETARAYRSDVAAFARWAERGGARRPADADRIVLRRYLAYLATRRYARATVARKAAALRAYFAWCAKEGLVPTDPARRLSAPSAEGRLPKVLSARDLGLLLDGDPSSAGTAPTRAVDAALGLRDDAVLELLYAAGLRVSELCGLDRAGVDLPGRTVTVVGKGDKERRLPGARPRCAEALRALAGRRTPGARRAREPRRGGVREPAWPSPRAARRPAHPRPALARCPPTPTPCATASPPTCSTAGPTCGWSRSCSATRASRRPRCTPT